MSEEERRRAQLFGCIVVSGLPGSGKSTLAGAIATSIGRYGVSWPVIDKDDLLERLFPKGGEIDARERRRLSRVADDQLILHMRRQPHGVMVSWWRHPQSTRDSGTPVSWFRAISTRVVEVHCVCAPDVAAARFVARTRHPGHLDATRNYADIVTTFTEQAALGPLAYSRFVSVRTDRDVDADAVTDAIVHEPRDS